MNKRQNKKEELNCLVGDLKSLKKYLEEIKKENYAPLSSDEQMSLLIKYRVEGDKEARKKLIDTNLRFVIKEATKISAFNMPLIDRIQEGNCGLIKAIERFDLKKSDNNNFLTYAVWWIKQSIISSYLKNFRGIIKKSINSKEEVIVTCYEERINYSKVNSLEDGLIQNFQFEDLRSALKKLQMKELEIISMYFSFGKYKDITPMTLKEIGEKVNLTKERVRQIKEKAIYKLRTYMNPGLYPKK